MKETLKSTGIILGFGNMGQTHYERYKDLGIEIVAVLDPDEDKGRLAKAAGLTVITTIADLYPSINFHFIDICSPTYLHFQHIQQAMIKNKPIFVEKPVVRTLDEVQRLRELAKGYKYPIFVGEVEQYNPGLDEFLQYRGKPKDIRISRLVNLDFFLKGARPWFLDTKLSGGIVLDLMIHDINLLVAKYGIPDIGEVEGASKKYDCIDEVRAILHFEEFDATLSSTWTSTNEQAPISVSIDIENEDELKQTAINCDNYVIRDKTDKEDAFTRELKAFLASVKTGKTPFSLEMYLKGIEIALGVRSRL